VQSVIYTLFSATQLKSLQEGDIYIIASLPDIGQARHTNSPANGGEDMNGP
jgi:hypothetical protein